MRSNPLKSLQAAGFYLASMMCFVVCTRADLVLYNDGVWIVNGIDAGTNVSAIGVSVENQPVGSFSELIIQRLYAGGLPVIYSIRADGALRPAVPPTGVLGGSFYLTSYWDCYLGQQPDVRITSLNIQPNTKKFNYLKFNGAVSNGSTLQATDFDMKLSLPDDSTVRLDVKYTLYAMYNICIDPNRQQSGEGFQVARMASNYISSQIKDNDGASVKGFIGPYCDCCSCWYNKGGVCANFVNADGYIYPYFVWMAKSQALMLHSLAGPRNTPALRIGLKNPSRKNCGVQGYTVHTANPAEENVNLWVNWQTANPSYGAGQKVRAIRLTLDALLPQPAVSCDILVP